MKEMAVCTFCSKLVTVKNLRKAYKIKDAAWLKIL